MNDDQFTGKWEQLKGSIRKEFAKLTDDDVAEVKGRKQNLLGKLQERYGDAKESAVEHVNATLARLEKSLDKSPADRR